MNLNPTSYLKYNPNNSNFAIIYIHGFLGNKYVWKPIIKEIKGNYCHISIDLPEYYTAREGLNSHLNISSFHDYLIIIKNQIQSILEKENISDYVLLGYSMGARISISLVVHQLLSPMYLIVESSGAGIDITEIENRKKWDKALKNELLTLSKEKFLDKWYNQPIFEGIKNSIYYPSYIKTIMKNNFKQIAYGLDYNAQSSMPNIWNKLNNITSKTLIIYGELDKKYALICTKLHSTLTNSFLIEIPNVSHNTHLINPLLYVQSITNFLKSN